MFQSGLVTLNDMKAKQEALVKEREKQLAKKEQSKELQLWVIILLRFHSVDLRSWCGAHVSEGGSTGSRFTKTPHAYAKRSHVESVLVYIFPGAETKQCVAVHSNANVQKVVSKTTSFADDWAKHAKRGVLLFFMVLDEAPLREPQCYGKEREWIISTQ